MGVVTTFSATSRLVLLSRPNDCMGVIPRNGENCTPSCGSPTSRKASYFAEEPKGEMETGKSTARTGKRPRIQGDFVSPDRKENSSIGVKFVANAVWPGRPNTLRPMTRVLT